MKKGNLAAAALCTALAIYAIVVAAGYPKAEAYGTGVPGPGLWPICIAAILLACVAILLFKTFRMKPEDNASLQLLSDGSKRAYISMAVLVLYVVLLEPLGFLIATSAMMFFFIMWFSKKKWFISAPIAVGCTLVIYLIFKMVLNVPVDFGIFAI